MNKMEHLPTEIVSHIGTFLNYKDRKTCFETSHAFECIHERIGRHMIRFDPTNFHQKMSHIYSTIKFVRRIKPSIHTFIFVFECLQHVVWMPSQQFDMSILHGINVILEFKTCGRDFITGAAALFEDNATKLRIGTPCLQGNEPWLNRQDIEHINTSIFSSNDVVISKIAHIPDTHIICNMSIGTLDLTPIDIARNKLLCVTLSESSHVSYIGLEKATMIHVRDTASFDALLSLNMRASRLQQIIFTNCEKIPPSTWRAIISHVPSTVLYRIHVGSGTPGCIWYLRELQARKCRYDMDVNTKQELLASHICKRFMNDRARQIMLTQCYTDDFRVPANATIHEIYDMMDLEYQAKWYPLVPLEPCNAYIGAG